ncbi:MAG: hypothetical protein SO072_13695 [Dysosmobacter sp.]|nr:hypothetical protein [Dysosmobacter sp.]
MTMTKAYVKDGRGIIIDAEKSPYSPGGGTGGNSHRVKPLIGENSVQEIESILRKGDRVEIIPVKDGVKIVRIRREVVKI